MNSPTSLFEVKAKGNISRYNEIRNQIKNGDVLMYRGKSLQSRIIMFVTRSRFSHAGIAVWWNERLMVMEAVGKGVVITPLSQSVGKYDGRVELFTSKEEIPDNERLRMITCAQEELGKEYATWKAVRVGIKILLSKNRERRDRLRRERQLFCSQYVAQIYNSVGRDLKRGVSDRFMTPGDIANSPLLKHVAVLRKARA